MCLKWTQNKIKLSTVTDNLFIIKQLYQNLRYCSIHCHLPDDRGHQRGSSHHKPKPRQSRAVPAGADTQGIRGCELSTFIV